MTHHRNQRLCFIIGPMKDGHLNERARLRKLAQQVVAPVLNEIGRPDGISYSVLTPYEQFGGNIINDVISAIDRADIVVADLTDSNPNVFYELGITHALGRPCVSVVESRMQVLKSGKIRRQALPFDVGAYRAQYIDLDEDKFAEARDKLRPHLEKAHRESDWRKLENPVIDFYRAPITFISPAFALAQGYYHNFIKPVVEAIILPNGERFLHPIVTGTKANPNPQKPEEAVLFPDDKRRKLQLHIIIPTRIPLAKHNYVDKLKGQNALYTAFIGSGGRPYTSFMRVYNEETSYALVDVPTTIRGMEDAVKRRLRGQFISYNEPEFREFEAQEIQRFATMLQTFIEENDHGDDFTTRIKVMLYDPERPAELLWLHNILNQ